MLGTGSVMSDYVLVTVILPLRPGDEDYAISCVVPNDAPGLKLYPRRPYALDLIPLFTRSFASWHARSTRPTIFSPGVPPPTRASTSTRRGSSPTRAWVTARASMTRRYG